MTSSKQDMGASAKADQALVASDGAASVSPLTGFDPSRMADRIAQIMWIEFCPGIRLTEEDVRHYRKIGQIALLRLREPTDEMIDAAAATPGMKAASSAMILHQARGYNFDAGAFDAGSPLHQAWRAMIDEAIAMEARQGGDGETRLHPKDDSAGPQDIAQKGSQ